MENNNTNTDYHQFVRVGKQKWEIVEITIWVIFFAWDLYSIFIHYFLYMKFSSATWKKSPPPKVPIPTQNPNLTYHTGGRGGGGGVCKPCIYGQLLSSENFYSSKMIFKKEALISLWCWSNGIISNCWFSWLLLFLFRRLTFSLFSIILFAKKVGPLSSQNATICSLFESLHSSYEN